MFVPGIKPALIALLTLIIALLTALFSGPTYGDNHPSELRVGVKPAAAFVIDGESGFSGEAIDRWEAMYDGNSTYVSYPTVAKLLEAVHAGEVDVAVGAISVTAKREGTVDFLMPYTQTGLSYASMAQDSITDLFWAVMPTFLKGLFIIFLVNLAAGALFATVEHKANDDVESKWTSMFVGFYWSSATLTTVGYGDIAAKTSVGKFISTIWMWSGLIITGMMTSLIVAAITVESSDNSTFNILESDVAVVEGSAGEDYVRQLAKPRKVHIFTTLEEAVASVNSGKTDGVVGDKILLDNVASDYDDVVVSNTLLTKDYYAFAVAEGVPYKEELNRRLLVTLED